jgi:hypothetical protein
MHLILFVSHFNPTTVSSFLHSGGGKLSIRNEDMAVEIRYDRTDRLYRPGEVVKGVVVILSKDSFSHNGVTLDIEGGVQSQLSSKNVGLFEAFASAAKPITLIRRTIELSRPGKAYPILRLFRFLFLRVFPSWSFLVFFLFFSFVRDLDLIERIVEKL